MSKYERCCTTVHEAKPIQTLPEDYKICGSWGEAMRQIGNAVPVMLAEKMGRALLAALNETRTTETARNRIVSNYTSSQPVQLRLALEKKRRQKTTSGTKEKAATKPKSVKLRYKRK